LTSSPRTEVRQYLQGAEMIQLATDPNASRSNWRPAAAEAKDNTLAGRRPRNAHAWPFISRHGERAAAPQETKRTPGTESGS
jgi:hypothetical protein